MILGNKLVLRVAVLIGALRTSVSWTTPSIDRAGCSVQFQDPETGCAVHLVGCFHGSQSSADDVQAILESSNPDEETTVVVLELCASRFQDLREDVLQSDARQVALANDDIKDDLQEDENISNAPWIVRFCHMVAETYQRKGGPTAAAAALLGGVGGLQTEISGLQPGLEFATAFRYAHARDQDVVLADQDVDDILQRLGNLPQLSWELLNQVVRGQTETLAQQANSLSTALWGRPEMSDCVTLPGFLTRSFESVKELGRLTLLPLIMLQVLQLFVGEPNDMAATMNPFELLFWNLFFLGVACLTVTLPATKVILTDRDDQLTKGVRAACRIATQQKDKSGRVVAVFGFLHVNGVAQRMQQLSDGDETASP